MLKKGDKVGIVSPATYVDEKDFAKGIEYLESLGFKCILGKNIFAKDFWMAGTGQQRAEDINAFFTDSSIKAIFSTRGGVGSIKTLDFLDYEAIKNNPKPLFGFSDITALQLGIYSCANIPSYTGFLLMYDFKNGNIDKKVEQSLATIFNDDKLTYQGGQTVNSGKVEGVLLGGTLSLLLSLVGTKYFPLKEDTILLLEDVDERTYRIDIMLDQLKKNTNFNKVKGIILGEFADCEDYKERYINLDEIIERFTQDLSIPVIKNFPYGHVPSRYVVPIGKRAILDADKCELTIL